MIVYRFWRYIFFLFSPLTAAPANILLARPVYLLQFSYLSVFSLALLRDDANFCLRRFSLLFLYYYRKLVRVIRGCMNACTSFYYPDMRKNREWQYKAPSDSKLSFCWQRICSSEEKISPCALVQWKNSKNWKGGNSAGLKMYGNAMFFLLHCYKAFFFCFVLFLIKSLGSKLSCTQDNT